MTTPQLDPVSARILGVLVEKEKTVPDSYPLSLNALQTGCNQKTSRHPVMDLSESQLLQTIDTLSDGVWIIASSGNRVTRYSHNIPRVLGIGAAATALLATLLLRGPQTAAELRANSERLYRFADVSSVEAFLEELSQRANGALVTLLPRAPGAREARWAHLLCGEPEVPAASSHSVRTDSSGLAERVTALEEEVARLAAIVARLAPAAPDEAA
ncbi:YceH family protein [Viridibacterium curvum]